jgi:hypothetical protein
MDNSSQEPPRLWIGAVLLVLWLVVIAMAAWAIWLRPQPF